MEYQRNPVAAFLGAPGLYFWQNDKDDDDFWAALGGSERTRKPASDFDESITVDVDVRVRLAQSASSRFSRAKSFMGEIVQPFEAYVQPYVNIGYVDSEKLRAAASEKAVVRPAARVPAAQKARVAPKPVAKQSDFKLHSRLGKGRFGDVVLASLATSAQLDLVAIKVLHKASLYNSKLRERARNERYINGTLKPHPFVVRMTHAFATQKSFCLVLELATCGELFGLIRSNHAASGKRFTERTARFYASECVLALEFLHEASVLYRDLKPENVLVGFDGHARLSDFGLSKPGVSDALRGARSMCGTPEYLAPEILRGAHEHGLAVDWWALGALLCELVYGQPPFYTKDKKLLFERISGKATFKAPSKLLALASNQPAVSKDCDHLIAALLNKTAADRLGSNGGAAEVKLHKFFAMVDFDAIGRKLINPPFEPQELAQVSAANNQSDVDWAMLEDEKPPQPRPRLDISAAKFDAIFADFNYVAPPPPPPPRDAYSQ